MTEIAVQATGLTMDFGSVRALEDLSLTVRAGSVLALLGPNGAGKSTFARIATGLLAPTAGGVSIWGHDARDLPPEVACQVVSVGESQDPPGSETIRSLMDLQADATAGFDRGWAERLCEQRELDRKKRFGALSKGQKRWVLSVLALASRAGVVFMDEPADGMDPAARRALYDNIRDCANDHGTTFIVATHIIGDIERVADDAAVIDRGRLILHGALEELREQVREIESPHPLDAAALGEDIDILSTRRIDNAALTCVRCPAESVAGLQTRLGDQAIFRTMGLETLYLAVTETPSAATKQETEEAPAC